MSYYCKWISVNVDAFDQGVVKRLFVFIDSYNRTNIIDKLV